MKNAKKRWSKVSLSEVSFFSKCNGKVSLTKLYLHADTGCGHRTVDFIPLVVLSGIILVGTFSVVYAESAITLKLKTPYYDLGQTIAVSGSVNFVDGVVAGTTSHRGLPVSIEVYDSNKNVVYFSSIPLKDDKFEFTISTGPDTKINSGGRYTIVAYYGSPQATLLNTPYSKSASFLIKNAPLAPTDSTTKGSPLVAGKEDGKDSTISQTDLESQSKKLMEQSGKLVKALPTLTGDKSGTSDQNWYYLLFLLLGGLVFLSKLRRRRTSVVDYKKYADQYSSAAYANLYRSAIGGAPNSGMPSTNPPRNEYRKSEEDDKLPS